MNDGNGDWDYNVVATADDVKVKEKVENVEDDHDGVAADDDNYYNDRVWITVIRR